MARPGLMRHRKFLRLAPSVGGATIARGALELIWDAAYENGDELIGDAVDVEAVACWLGEKGVLCQALLEAGGSASSGFIDRGEDGLFYVHDLWDHAPRYVANRAKRESDRIATGKSLSEVRAAAGRKRSVTAKRSANGSFEPAPEHQQPANGRSLDGVTPASEHRQPASEQQLDGTPAPAPAPAPAPEEALSISSTRAPLAVDLQALWNETTKPPLPKWMTMSGTRARACRVRLAERPLDQWREVIARIAASNFCGGQNDRAWIAGPDFLLRPGTADKVLEGQYDNRTPTPIRSKTAVASDAARDWTDYEPKLKANGDIEL